VPYCRLHLWLGSLRDLDLGCESFLFSWFFIQSSAYCLTKCCLTNYLQEVNHCAPLIYTMEKLILGVSLYVTWPCLTFRSNHLNCEKKRHTINISRSDRNKSWPTWKVICFDGPRCGFRPFAVQAVPIFCKYVVHQLQWCHQNSETIYIVLQVYLSVVVDGVKLTCTWILICHRRCYA
jgi:hypothetical protein